MKCGAVAVLFILIGIIVFPSSIGSSIPLSAMESVGEVTIQVVGQGNIQSHSVILSQQQYQNLTLYLVGLRARLNTTTNPQEVRALLCDAVGKIHSYGVFPNGMSVTQVQRLICGSALGPRIRSLVGTDDLRGGNWKIFFDNNPDLKNSFCFMSATATKIPGYVPSPMILPFGLLLLFGMLPAFFVSLLGQQELANTLAELGLRLWTLNPIRVSNYVMILGYDVELRSIGLRGIVNKNLREAVLFRGYSGLMLSTSNETTLFLGFALNVISPP